MLFAALEAECPHQAKAETLGMGQQQKHQDNAKRRGEQQNDPQRRREQIIDGAEGRYSLLCTRPTSRKWLLQSAFDHFQSVLAVKHVAVDEICRRAEHRALNRFCGILFVKGKYFRRESGVEQRCGVDVYVSSQLGQSLRRSTVRIVTPMCLLYAMRQRKSPAIKGKRVCRIHGGKSTGPKTDAGRQRCAAAKTTHGWETREKRRMRAEKLRELREMEGVLKLKGLLV
jgi:hypothetical protein